MRVLFRNLFQSPMRNATAEEAYIFAMRSVAGGLLSDEITGTLATTAISGTRYGIVNGAVTLFAVNQPPIEDDGLRGCPAFTQLCKQSETLTDANWAKTNIDTPTLSDVFEGCNIYSIKETAVSGAHLIDQRAVYLTAVDNSVLGISFIAKADGRIFGYVARKRDNTEISIKFDLSTGAVVGATTGWVYSIVNKGNGYYQIFAAVNIGAGATTAYIRPALFDSSLAEIYVGDASKGVFLGQPIHVNYGVVGTPFIPPYVPNNTAGSISVVSEAATATTGTSFDLDNALLDRLKTALRGPNAQGHLELTFKSNFDSGWLPIGVSTTLNIFSISNDPSLGSLYVLKGSDGVVSIRLYDGSQVRSVVLGSIISGQTFKISFDYGTHPTGQKMRLTVNGVKSAISNFVGSFGTQDMRFFYGNTVHAGWIVKDSLKVSDMPQW